MKKLITTVTTFATGLYFALPVFAQGAAGVAQGAAGKNSVNLCVTLGSVNLCNITLGAVLTAGIKMILIVALVLAFLFLVIGGVRWILSGGDKAGTEAAKGTITAALIGLVIVFLAWMFLNLVGGFFGVNTGSTFTLPSITNPGSGG